MASTAAWLKGRAVGEHCSAASRCADISATSVETPTDRTIFMDCILVQ
jgi:hypothetical protein